MKPVDLLITNGHVLNVFNGQIETHNVAIAEGKIVGFGNYPAQAHLDAEGRYILPGFCEGHIHIESCKLSPLNFAQTVLLHGTTTVVADPHEIANVAGLAGIHFLFASVPAELLDLYVMAPSCVPATPFETAGAEIGVAEIKELLQWPRVIGLGEMMNFPGVLAGAKDVLTKLKVAAGRPIDGHAPGLTGRELMAYIAAGPQSDHECVTLAEGEERLRLGMWLMIREGSAAKNLEALAPLLCSNMKGRCLLVSDDVEAEDLLHRGHLDYVLRRTVALGVAPVDAVRAVSLNVAQRFGWPRQGAVAPGFKADLVLVDDLQNFNVHTVIKRGQIVVNKGIIEENRVAPLIKKAPDAPDKVWNSVRVETPALEQLRVRMPSTASQAHVRVIEAQEGSIVTKAATAWLPMQEGNVEADPSQDVLKLVVLERYGKNGNIAIGFVRGFGLRQGAIATTVAHDSHNVLIVGADDVSIRTAVAAIKRLQGGQVVTAGEHILAELPLPLGGLMSDLPAKKVAQQTQQLRLAAAELGCRLASPLMTLSFLALPVIPQLRLTDRGLFDGERFAFTELFV